MKTVCLNMIVKNERRAIERCLSSVKPFIHSWVIVDTGSQDGTQEIIKQTLSDLPGRLYERPWIDFSANRNEAMELANSGSDYLLLIDADEELSYSQKEFPNLTEDVYFIINQIDQLESLRPFLIRQNRGWRWRGSIHEELISSSVRSGRILEGAVLYSIATDGFRSLNPSKIQKDIFFMLDELNKKPQDKRLLFHIASGYDALGNWELALPFYQRRILLEGCSHELYICHLRSAIAMSALLHPLDATCQEYERALSLLPTRAEAHIYYADLWIQLGNYRRAYSLTKQALSFPFPEQIFRVEREIYEYGRHVRLAECAWRIGQTKESFDAIQYLLALPNLPLPLRTAFEKNIRLNLFDPFRK